MEEEEEVEATVAVEEEEIQQNIVSEEDYFDSEDFDLRSGDSAAFSFNAEEKDQYYCGATIVTDRFNLETSLDAAMTSSGCRLRQH